MVWTCGESEKNHGKRNLAASKVEGKRHEEAQQHRLDDVEEWTGLCLNEIIL